MNSFLLALLEIQPARDVNNFLAAPMKGIPNKVPPSGGFLKGREGGPMGRFGGNTPIGARSTNKRDGGIKVSCSASGKGISNHCSLHQSKVVSIPALFLRWCLNGLSLKYGGYLKSNSRDHLDKHPHPRLAILGLLQ